MSNYYRAVVLDQNNWSPTSGHHCELHCCGHRHRTLQAAWDCLFRQPHTIDWQINSHVVDQDDVTQDTSCCDGRYN